MLVKPKCARVEKSKCKQILLLQGDDKIKCPYLFRTHWEYADVEQPGWQWVYDFTGRLVCPNDPCSMTKCGFHATCSIDNGQVSEKFQNSQKIYTQKQFFAFHGIKFHKSSRL